jgi:DNA-binding winged helix-turn-helix (wHTH) protein
MDDKNGGAPRPEDVLIDALLQATGRTASAVYEFGSFRLEISEQRLLRDGAAVSLAPKEFETLRLLVERHGRLVTKQELLDRVWAGTFVGEDTIAQRISCLRKALGGDPASTKYIETVPKRGYRFVADVTVK